ncbi:hypothetical protein GC197_00570 [bacterium]|nr:hypothetical protein [bacterium]
MRIVSAAVLRCFPTLIVLLAVGQFVSAENLRFVKEPELIAARDRSDWLVSFELSSYSDVEVAILSGDQSKVVRHVAAGVLGPKAPSPLVANSLRQTIRWDGKDDYGQPVKEPSKVVVRVRAGMQARLQQIVGGDPYAYYSQEMGDSDHSPWGINGLEAKSDGKVYIWGHSSNLGPPALRQYDIDGNYLQTLFPMPAGKDIQAMKGWGIHEKPDGSYTPIFNRLTDPSLTTTFLDDNLRMARMLPTEDPGKLRFWKTGFNEGSFQVLEMNADGTIAQEPEKQLLGSLVNTPPFKLGPIEPGSHTVHSMMGPVFICDSADHQSFYLSGIYAATSIYGSVKSIEMDSFWRDGQVWKVDKKTRTAKPVFALEKSRVPVSSQDRANAYGGSNSYAALHGVTVDAQGHLFVCDRLNQRIVVLDEQGKTIHEILCEHPDAIAVSKSGALYVTTRYGDYHRPGLVKLLKYKNWQTSDPPVEASEVSKTGFTRRQTHSFIAVCDAADGTRVWVAHTQMPVRVYRDEGEQLKLVKDFYHVNNAQRCLGFDRMQVDPVTETAYVMDSHDSVWKVSNWEAPRFEKIPIETASIGIDARNRYLYARTLRDGSSSNSRGKIGRFHLDENYTAANVGDTGSNRVTPQFHYEWCFEGNSDKGIAVAPNGNVALVGDPDEGLKLFVNDEAKLPWQSIKIADLPNNAGGVRFDLAGNLYVGMVSGPASESLPELAKDHHAAKIGRIYRFSPTGTLQSGNLFPSATEGPLQVYDVPYGAFESNCVTRSPRFGVDGFGRIYCPTNVVQRITVIDNAGNEILHFGTYGNRDSLGEDGNVPLGFPNSVDATDDYIYVADMVNLRLVRLKKEFAVTAVSRFGS